MQFNIKPSTILSHTDDRILSEIERELGLAFARVSRPGRYLGLGFLIPTERLNSYTFEGLNPFGPSFSFEAGKLEGPP